MIGKFNPFTFKIVLILLDLRMPFCYLFWVQLVKNPPAVRKTWVRSLGWEDPLEKGTASHSSILAWRIPRTVSFVGSQRVGHDWVIFTSTFCISHVFFSPSVPPLPPSFVLIFSRIPFWLLYAFFNYTVDLWTTQIWTVQVYLSIDFFSINMYSIL